jgi:hypothetical protein
VLCAFTPSDDTVRVRHLVLVTRPRASTVVLGYDDGGFSKVTVQCHYLKLVSRVSAETSDGFLAR